MHFSHPYSLVRPDFGVNFVCVYVRACVCVYYIIILSLAAVICVECFQMLDHQPTMHALPTHLFERHQLISCRLLLSQLLVIIIFFIVAFVYFYTMQLSEKYFINCKIWFFLLTGINSVVHVIMVMVCVIVMFMLILQFQEIASLYIFSNTRSHSSIILHLQFTTLQDFILYYLIYYNFESAYIVLLHIFLHWLRVSDLIWLWISKTADIFFVDVVRSMYGLSVNEENARIVSTPNPAMPTHSADLPRTPSASAAIAAMLQHMPSSANPYDSENSQQVIYSKFDRKIRSILALLLKLDVN